MDEDADDFGAVDFEAGILRQERPALRPTNVMKKSRENYRLDVNLDVD
jgi:hypothetical protein